jgi:hypothetical protein
MKNVAIEYTVKVDSLMTGRKILNQIQEEFGGIALVDKSTNEVFAIRDSYGFETVELSIEVNNDHESIFLKISNSNDPHGTELFHRIVILYASEEKEENLYTFYGSGRKKIESC